MILSKLYRRKIISVLFVSLCLLSDMQAQVSRQRELTAREIAQKSFPSVVMLITEDAKGKLASQGSGFFVRDDVIATNYHVIENASRIHAKVISQKTVYDIVGIVGEDKERDLALLKVKGIKARPLALGNIQQVAVGDGIYVVGNPEGLEGTFSEGIVSALRGSRYIQITAPISHGSSGGPVLNKRGQVIGVAVGIYKEGQNLNFAVPVPYLSFLISRMQPLISPDDDEKYLDPATPNNNTSIAQAHYDKGNAYFVQNRYAEAIEAFQQVVRLQPTDFFAWGQLGFAYSQLHQYDQAIKACQEAIRLKPDYDYVHYLLGSAYRDQGKLDEAITHLREAVRLDPKSAYNRYWLGIALYDKRDFGAAIIEYQKGVSLNQDNFSLSLLHRGLGDALYRKGWRSCQELWKLF